MPTCPACTSTAFSTLVPSERVDEECREREQFVADRLPRPASADELKDLTSFFHQSKANIMACADCGLLVREEHEPPPAETYSEDDYDPTVMENLFPRYLEAFRSKAHSYRALLPQVARVLEIGSHYGAFLQAAQEWGWSVEGVDVGKDTSRFARSKGFTVHSKELSDCRFPDRSFDGVFIWNCFEQILDPKPTLAECRRIVKPGGVLVVRTPNGLLYSVAQKLLADRERNSGLAESLKEAMAYNNLLGFPYQYGYSAATLERLIEPFGFKPDGKLNSELITLPLPEKPNWVETQEQAVNSELRSIARAVQRNGEDTLLGPWIEVWFRRANGEY